MNDQTTLETLSQTNAEITEGFSFYQMDRKEFIHFHPGIFHQILFLMEGKIHLEGDEETKLNLHAGECMMISQYKNVKITARKYSYVILFSFKTLINKEDKNYFKSLIDKTDSISLGFYPSGIRPMINNFLSLLCTYRFHGLDITPLQELKHQELFLLFKHYLTEKETIALFHPLIHRITDFRQQIIDNYHIVSGVTELISITGLSRTTFERKFREYFGTSAHQWLLKQKARQVWTLLADSDLTLDQIRRQTGFNSATHFVRFCRQQFGTTPSQIRKQLKKGKDPNHSIMNFRN